MTGLTNYSPDRPLILLTDYSPRFGGGGAVNLRSVMDPQVRRRIVWATLTPGGETGESNPDERVVVLNGGSTPRTSRSLFKDSTTLAKPLANEVLEVARSHNARGIWVVMHGAGVPIAANLVKMGNLPLMASVHDDPAFGVALRSRRYLVLVPWIEHCFAGALKGAAAIEVVSRGMKERYESRYGVKTVFGNRVVPDFPIVEAPFDKAQKVMRIEVLGNTYSYGPLPILAQAVGRAAKELGVRGELVFVGQGQADRLRAEVGSLIDVVGIGQVNEARATDVLRNSFLQYLNYPFSQRDAVLRQTSFPIKLGTYIAAGRPLLVNCPDGSSTAEIPSLFPGVGFHWNSFDPADGARVLVQAWNDPATERGVSEQLDGVRRKYFDEIMIRENVLGSLNAMVGPL